jgi:hypothetical protein
MMPLVLQFAIGQSQAFGQEKRFILGNDVKLPCIEQTPLAGARVVRQAGKAQAGSCPQTRIGASAVF